MNEEKKVPFKWEYGEETISLQLGMYANNQRLYIGMITHILIGAGMALTAAWNGAPASYPGAITRQEKVNRALQAVSGRAFRGSSLMDSGAQEAITIWLPEMQFSLTGIWMGQQTMWVS